MSNNEAATVPNTAENAEPRQSGKYFIFFLFSYRLSQSYKHWGKKSKITKDSVVYLCRFLSFKNNMFMKV